MKKKRALVTGIYGFVGGHLVDELQKRGYEVFGIARRYPDELEQFRFGGRQVKIFYGDINSYAFVEMVIDQLRPDVIFHLAAMSFVKESFDAPFFTIENNVVPQLNIFESVRLLRDMDKDFDPVIQIACSSEEYGLVKKGETPITELNELRPLSQYGVSKVTQDMLAYQYYQSYGLKTIITRAFNHEGYGRGLEFVTSNFAKQIVEMEKGYVPPVIHHGNLDSIRDFTDVRDMVRAYCDAVETAEYGTRYNICSGKGVSIEDMLATLIDLSTIEEIECIVDKDRIRPSDVDLLIGDCSKFKLDTLWEPKYSLEETLSETLRFWREYIR